MTATQQQATGHIHQFTPSELWLFNASHSVNHMSFGTGHSLPKALVRIGEFLTPSFLLHPGAVEHPLDGVEHIVRTDTARFIYFIKVVPTTFVYSSGRTVETYQISHKEHILPIVIGPSFKQPGIFFRYELSPYHVTIRQEQESLAHVTASCCAIVGGVFVVMGFVSDLISHLIDRRSGEVGAGTSLATSSSFVAPVDFVQQPIRTGVATTPEQQPLPTPTETDSSSELAQSYPPEESSKLD